MTVYKRKKFSKRGKSSDCNPLPPQNGWAVYLFSLKRKGNLISSWWHLCEKVDPWQRKTSNKNKRTMVGEVETICYSNTEIIICCAIKAWHLKGHLSNTGSCKLFQSPSLLSSVLVTQAHQCVHQMWLNLWQPCLLGVYTLFTWTQARKSTMAALQLPLQWMGQGQERSEMQSKYSMKGSSSA